MNNFIQELGIQSQNDGVSTGAKWVKSQGLSLDSFSPVDGKLIASVSTTDKDSYNKVVDAASKAFVEWRQWPAPRRGEIVRQIGERLRELNAMNNLDNQM